uniref:Uncharacterized protein n=2 Tax=Pinguiococcus pyrenoidosus TaxID=172671 RepID=A0A7R9UC82_9STRA|mmetsp:Transcript_5206/g.20712  ORF Transcript_5206/g.20712 Transcript_5206/m.20712 type:complete len:452 (+) Transcript_5206:80-1435(+)
MESLGALETKQKKKQKKKQTKKVKQEPERAPKPMPKRQRRDRTDGGGAAGGKVAKRVRSKAPMDVASEDERRGRARAKTMKREAALAKADDELYQANLQAYLRERQDKIVVKGLADISDSMRERLWQDARIEHAIGAENIFVCLAMHPWAAVDRSRIDVLSQIAPKTHVITASEFVGTRDLLEELPPNLGHVSINFSTRSRGVRRTLAPLLAIIREMNPAAAIDVFIDYFWLENDYYLLNYGTHWIGSAFELCIAGATRFILPVDGGPRNRHGSNIRNMLRSTQISRMQWKNHRIGFYALGLDEHPLAIATMHESLQRMLKQRGGWRYQARSYLHNSCPFLAVCTRDDTLKAEVKHPRSNTRIVLRPDRGFPATEEVADESHEPASPLDDLIPCSFQLPRQPLVKSVREVASWGDAEWAQPGSLCCGRSSETGAGRLRRKSRGVCRTLKAA